MFLPKNYLLQFDGFLSYCHQCHGDYKYFQTVNVEVLNIYHQQALNKNENVGPVVLKQSTRRVFLKLQHQTRAILVNFQKR